MLRVGNQVIQGLRGRQTKEDDLIHTSTTIEPAQLMQLDRALSDSGYEAAAREMTKLTARGEPTDIETVTTPDGQVARLKAGDRVLVENPDMLGGRNAGD